MKFTESIIFPRSRRRLPRKLLCLLLALPLIAATAPALALGSSMTVGIVASDTMELAPLSLRERDPVSMLALVYEGLFTLDDDEQPVGKLAKYWEFSNNGKRLDITLQPNVTFHNGDPLTASDVCATLDRIRELSGLDAELESVVELPPEERGLYQSLMYFIKDWKASEEDELQLSISLRRGYYGALYALTFPILPAGEVDQSAPAGTGPYRIEEYEPGVRLWLMANTAWWQRPPQVTDVVANIYAGTEDVLDAFESGDVDVTMTRSLNATRYSGSLNSYMITYRTRQLEVLLMNHKYKKTDGALDDARMRQAISLAIDRDALIKSVYQNMATPATGPVMSGTWLYEESTANQTQNAGQSSYNPEKARSLLDEMGWKLASDGKRYKTDNAVEGQGLYFTILVYDEPGTNVRRNAAEQIAQMLKAVGINITVYIHSYEDVMKSLNSGNYSLALCAYNLDVVPDPGFMLLSSAGVNYPGANFARYNSSDMNELIRDLRAAYDPAAFKSKLSEVQRLFTKDLPFAPLYWRTGALLAREAFTEVRDVRELELLRGLEAWTY